jgi:malate dehydrogenase
MSQNHVKVVVSGAGGQIGYALAFRLASGEVFGPNITLDLHLLEVEPALPSLTGLCMELDDCAFPLLRRVIATSSLKEAMDGANWVLLVGATPRKDGMERSDLLKINGGIFGPQGKAINDYAAKDVRILVVGNPCNTNCLIALNHAPDVPKERFYAMTMLDQNRARTMIAKKAGVLLTQVKQLVIWGNHSSTQYPDFYNAKIDGKPVTNFINDQQWLENEFVDAIQKRGAAVIKARGASSAGSAANGIITTVRNLITETATDDAFSVGSYSAGEHYGIDKGIIFSFPSRTVNGKVQIVTDYQHNAYAQQRIKMTEEELKKERDAVRELGLIE